MSRSEWLRRLALAAALGALGFGLWPMLGSSSEAAFRAASNAALGGLTFGRGGHIALAPGQPRAQRPSYDDASSWSSRLTLAIDDVEAQHSVRVNARRLLYLPSVLLAALVLASPLTLVRKSVALALGASLVLGSALFSVWLTAAWLFAKVPGLVYDLSALERRMLDIGYEAWVTALGNRYLAPLVIAVVLVLLLRVEPRARLPEQPRASKATVTVARRKKSRARNSRVRARA